MVLSFGTCDHETGTPTELFTGKTALEMAANTTAQYHFSFDISNTTYLPVLYSNNKSLYVQVEPCVGNVFLYGRLTYRCYPDSSSGSYVDIQSVDNGSRSHAVSTFWVPLTTTRYFLTMSAASSVDAKANVYVTPNISEWILPGSDGELKITTVERHDSILSFKKAQAAGPVKYSIYTSSEPHSFSRYAQLDAQSGNYSRVNDSFIMSSACGTRRSLTLNAAYTAALQCGATECSLYMSQLSVHSIHYLNVVVDPVGDWTYHSSSYGGVYWWQLYSQTNPTVLTDSQVGGVAFGVTVVLASVILVSFFSFRKLLA